MRNNQVQTPASPPVHPPFRQRAGELVRAACFIFNTGYLGTFATLIPLLGPVPLILMSLNWLLGTAVLSYKKKFLPASWDKAITSASENKPVGKLLGRNN